MKSPIASLLSAIAAIVALSVGWSSGAVAQNSDTDALALGFKNPPPAAKPRVWWHWLDGNVSEEGIRKDLAWLDSVGVGGVHNFDAALGLPGSKAEPLVNERVAYLTPRWRDLFRFAVDRAHQLGMEFTIAASPGWSESGGPWVKPEQGMKKLVWSEATVEGGKRFSGALPQPPRATGPFQNVPFDAGPFAKVESVPEYYADVTVIAYRVPVSERASGRSQPVITSSGGTIDAGRLSDGDVAQPVSLAFADDSTSWIQFAYGKPQRIQSITIFVARPSVGSPSDMATGGAVWLEASDDGESFRKVIDIPRDGSPQQTLSFSPVTARMFRIVLESPPRRPGVLEMLGLPSPPAPTAHQIFECILHTAARVNRFEDKAGFSNRAIDANEDTPPIDAREAIDRSTVLDLSDKLRADGTLDWTPPAGRWALLRLGYSLTGRLNHPASREGTGLEVDKLNRNHVRAYFDAYLAEYKRALGPQLIGKQGLQYMLTDSYEAGSANWTDDLLTQFRQRRGYDARPWLPVLAGRIVEGAAQSDRFLWDFRQTLADLIADAHYAELSAALKEQGMGRYGESHEGGRAFLGDGMQAKKSADVPMGALWASAPWESGQTYEMDIRESASVAHIYGQNLVAAESLTAFGNAMGFTPESLKPFADRELAAGLNRFVIHTSVHQPDDRPGPGATLGPFGQWFTRHETWAGQAGPWISYLTRSSYLLQQGRFVADIAYLYGEENNITNLFGRDPPPIPQGYGFDFVNADALVNVLEVKDGKLTTPSGMQYQLLALDESTARMSLRVLRKIRDLVAQGVTVVGRRPVMTPSLADDDAEFKTITEQLWGDGSGDTRRKVRTTSVSAAVSELALTPDFLASGQAGSLNLQYVHRALDRGDLYFVASPIAEERSVDVSFRVSGMAPEIWRADSGEIAPASYRIEGGRTIVPLQLRAHDALFVVFRQPTTETRRVIVEPVRTVVSTVNGPWDVNFQPERGAPPQIRLESLASWTQSVEPGVKYFSGTATYVTTFTVDAAWRTKGARLQLDLGQVKNLAEVSVNGRSSGVAWKAPFTVDITDAVRPGKNRLEVKVTNLWPNRMIGDKQPGAQRVAFSSYDPFKADSPLLPSGLLGPVTIVRKTSQP